MKIKKQKQHKPDYNYWRRTCTDSQRCSSQRLPTSSALSPPSPNSISAQPLSMGSSPATSRMRQRNGPSARTGTARVPLWRECGSRREQSGSLFLTRVRVCQCLVGAVWVWVGRGGGFVHLLCYRPLESDIEWVFDSRVRVFYICFIYLGFHWRHQLVLMYMYTYTPACLSRTTCISLFLYNIFYMYSSMLFLLHQFDAIFEPKNPGSFLFPLPERVWGEKRVEQLTILLQR